MNRLFLVLLAAVAFACSSEDSPTGPSSITTEEITVGSGATAQVGSRVSTHYRGLLQNGTVFDSSYGGATLDFVVGSANLIPGYQQGVVGMKVGGKRRVTIPPSLAYGSQGQGPIPPNATIIFEIELLSVS